MATPQTGGLTLRGLLGWLLGIDLVLAAASATANSLDIYMIGTAAEASAPATVGATIFAWLGSFLITAVIHGVLLGLVGLVCAVIVGGIFTVFSKSGKDAEKLFARLLTWGVGLDLVLAFIFAGYNATVHYGAISVLKGDPTLNLIASTLFGAVTFIWGVVGIAFIGLIATIVLSVAGLALSGALAKKKPDTNDTTSGA